MEVVRRAKIAVQSPALLNDEDVNDWSKEDNDSVKEATLPAAPIVVMDSPPLVLAQRYHEEIESNLQELQLEKKEMKLLGHEEIEDLGEKEEEKKRHLNVVFIGHVDAGKSTTGGQLLLLSGQVDERTIQKYEKEAKEKNRESWYMAYIMDTNEEERIKGKTVE
ncbi:eukaryotic peptide chain release factor GTP-binding subunit ERF3A-like, partial [Dendrobium catenatum]|uniref:eukaryotic peptide chain release factor GTP-binding subunit ERF3A-like n=1 Tax=Dendrobium catenatum TaxID=906689 RepID=UPI0010A010DF